MPNRAFLQVPPAPVVLAAAIFLAVLLGRGASVTEDRPFFLPSETNSVHVQLSGPGLSSGVYQLNDGLSVLDVINLTDFSSDHLSPPAEGHFRPAINGANYVITKKDQKIEIVQRGWMSAGKRIALGIPLHPDRMSVSDWVALPGIGVKLAKRISTDRQKNGEFNSLSALQRVKGIGPGKISSWKLFF
jgi:competence protein ComEA